MIEEQILPPSNSKTMRYSINYNRPATEQVEEKSQEADLEVLYESIAKEWARSVPEARDDLIAWPLIIEKSTSLAKAGAVLDIGCGTGNICRLLAPFAKTVIGLDKSRSMIAEAECIAGPPNVHYVRSDMLKATKIIAPNSIDLAVSIFGYCSQHDEEELGNAFDEARKVLRPAGFMLVQLPHPAEPFFGDRSSWARDLDTPKTYFANGSTVRRKLRLASGREVLVGRHHFSLAAYVSAITNAGFSICEFLEPRPSSELLERFPDLRFEATYPTSILLVLRSA
jgi:SAM-dependent methyltransferase